MSVNTEKFGYFDIPILLKLPVQQRLIAARVPSFRLQTMLSLRGGKGIRPLFSFRRVDSPDLTFHNFRASSILKFIKIEDRWIFMLLNGEFFSSGRSLETEPRHFSTNNNYVFASQTHPSRSAGMLHVKQHPTSFSHNFVLVGFLGAVFRLIYIFPSGIRQLFIWNWFLWKMKHFPQQIIICSPSPPKMLCKLDPRK